MKQSKKLRKQQAEREANHVDDLTFLDQHAIDFPDFDVSELRAALERRVATKRRELDHPDAPSSSLN